MWPPILRPIPGRPTPSASVGALKYEDEETYRYLIASDLSWRTLDIVQGQTLRWLVEVFVQDWKGHEGWAQLTKQPGEEGARRSVILSLLVDHALFVHPAQEQPACVYRGEPEGTRASREFGRCH